MLICVNRRERTLKSSKRRYCKKRKKEAKKNFKKKKYKKMTFLVSSRYTLTKPLVGLRTMATLKESNYTRIE